MLNLRRYLLMIALSAAAVLPGCDASEHDGLAPDVRRELEASRALVDGWAEAARAGIVPADEVVIGLGYAERLRLGLGSPFRLMESALRDPRLPEPVQRQIAWALLEQTLAGATYEIDAVALDRAGTAGVASWPGLGRHHLGLIEDAVTGTRDPRAGELAVRLAYRLAAMDGSVPAQAPLYATRAAALVRDREIARADARRLLHSAEVAQGDPLRAIAHWRAQRWLRVEAPRLETLPAQAEREALELAPKLAQSLRELAPRLGDVTEHRADAPDVNPSLLTREVAARLTVLADSLNAPPQTPIAIAARTYRQELMNQPWLTHEERARRSWFTTLANEEQFAAAYAQLVRRSPYDAAPSLAAVWAAVALRTNAQDPVWFPGFGGPSARELEERFGLAAVRFSDEVSAEWRPYYRTMLAAALTDMQSVLPSLDVRGLSIRFAIPPRGEGTLAMHDPRARELVLPPRSSAGTIAHEVAHDLDWQVALRRYRVRGDYASDRASRAAARGDRLAVHVRSLAQGAALDESGDAPAHARRPAENFARAIDWFVAASLAAQGRTNGYLTSIQDEVLTGYGTVRPPDISGRAGDAIIDILDDVAPLHSDTRERFLKQYGTTRALGPFDLTRAMMEIALPQPSAVHNALASAANRDVRTALSAIDAQRTRGFAAVDEWVCRAPAGAHDRALEQARRQLVIAAAAARTRGVVLQHARSLSGEAGARWTARRLYGGPWPSQELDAGLEQMLGELVSATRDSGHVQASTTAATFRLASLPASCGSGLFVR